MNAVCSRDKRTEFTVVKTPTVRMWLDAGADWLHHLLPGRFLCWALTIGLFFSALSSCSPLIGRLHPALDVLVWKQVSTFHVICVCFYSFNQLQWLWSFCTELISEKWAWKMTFIRDGGDFFKPFWLQSWSRSLWSVTLWSWSCLLCIKYISNKQTWSDPSISVMIRLWDRLKLIQSGLTGSTINS